MVNHLIKLTVSLGLVSSMFVGCGSSTQPKVEKKEEKADFRCRQDGLLAPQFTCDPYSEGFITALGVAKMNAGKDKAYQRTEAIASARDELAKQLEVKVSNLFKKYKASTGTASSATFDQSSSLASQQLASQTLVGSKQIGNSWRHPETKELFIMLGIDTEAVKNKMDDVVKTSFKNDEAMYQKFLAEKANGDLARELEKANK